MDNSTELKDTGTVETPETTNPGTPIPDESLNTDPEKNGFAKPDPEKNGKTVIVEKPTQVSPVVIDPNSKTEKKGSKRLTITVNFSLDEVEYMDEIIKARIDSKLSKNASHFIRQCVDFAIHHKPGTKIAIPEITPVEIKDGFYHPSK